MIPVRADGLLREFAEAGVLTAADVHVALRLARLGGERRETVLLAAALNFVGGRAASVPGEETSEVFGGRIEARERCRGCEAGTSRRCTSAR